MVSLFVSLGHVWEHPAGQYLQVFGYCGQGSTLVVVDGPVVELPRLSVAVTLRVTFPPTGNGPMAPDQVEPDPDIVVLPAPEGPFHVSTTESRPDSSDAVALTMTVRPPAPQVDPPTDGRLTVGGVFWVSRTVIGTVPLSQLIATTPFALPSDSPDRRADTTTVADPPPEIDPPAGERVSHGFDVVTR